MNKAPTRKTVAQACDACRRRKVKCNGLQPCPGCTSAELPCTFNLPQKRGGNRGPRATVLNELRAGLQRDEGGGRDGADVESASLVERGLQSPRDVTSNLEDITIDVCIETYLKRIWPVVPFLSRETLKEHANRTSSSLLSRQFIIAFCAYVVTFGELKDDPLFAPCQTSGVNLGPKLLEAALRIQNPERLTQPSSLSVYVSFFLYGALAGMGDYRQGWFWLREATTLYLMQKGSGEVFDDEAYACLFWVLLVSERAHGIRRTRPITLQITPSSPVLSASSKGLYHLASLFRPFDDLFFAVWNGSRHECSKDWLLGLERDVRTALPSTLDVGNEQLANLRVSQLWLQIKLWELFPRFGFLSSDEAVGCLSFGYPIEVARDLTILGMKLPIGSLQIHGVGMTEKIFDIACALTDILPFLPTTTPSAFELSPLNHLTQTTSLLAKLPGGTTKFVPLLLAKVQELLPELVVALREGIDGTVVDVDAIAVMSPHTRVVYEEEVGSGLYENLRRER